MIYQALVKQDKKRVEYQVFPREEFLPHVHPKFATKAIHEGQEPEAVHGSINVPIHMSSTFAQKDIGVLYSEFDYCRCGNPTRSAFEKVMASVEYGKFSIAFSSGCGAMTSVLHLLKTGEHLIACDDVYGGTQRYMRLFCQKQFGIELDFVDMTNLDNISKAIKPNTKMIWIQTPTNPTLKLIDIEAVAKLAKEKGILTVGDNTFCNPYLQSPLLLGVDISLNSCTKYIGGHSDVVMGVIVMNCEKLSRQLFMAAKSIGACPSPFDTYLCLRGLKTLEVRTIQICRNAYILAHFLEKHPLVEKAIYPGLKSHPQHEIAKKQMRGYGGMISFLIKGGVDEASKFLRALKIFTLAESLGGVEGLAECPALMTHFSVPPETRKTLGILDNLIRLSVGIEDIDDIVNDINDALEASTKPNPPKEADK